MHFRPVMKSPPFPPQYSLAPSRRRSTIRAFSLIETAIALGIVAFVLVALMGMLPVGLSSFRQSIDATVCAQIIQRIVSDAEQSDFDLLSKKATSTDATFFVLPTRYFDDQGNEIVPAAASGPTAAEWQRIIYQVRVRGSQPGPPDSSAAPAANFTSLPQEGTRFHPRDSSFLTIQIANNPGNRTLPVGTEQLWSATEAKKMGLALTTQSAIVTRNGPKRTTQ